MQINNENKRREGLQGEARMLQVEHTDKSIPANRNRTKRLYNINLSRNSEEPGFTTNGSHRQLSCKG